MANARARMVGESYKDYADRMHGWARAAEVDRDAALAELQQLRARDEAAEAVVADALALVDDLLRPWGTARPVHPGEPCLAAGYERVADVQSWRDRRDKLGFE